MFMHRVEANGREYLHLSFKPGDDVNISVKPTGTLVTVPLTANDWGLLRDLATPVEPAETLVETASQR